MLKAYLGPVWYDILGALLALLVILVPALMMHLSTSRAREKWLNQVTNRSEHD